MSDLGTNRLQFDHPSTHNTVDLFIYALLRNDTKSPTLTYTRHMRMGDDVDVECFIFNYLGAKTLLAKV